MDEAYIVTTLSPMRKIIATRMVEVKRTVPHFRLVTDIEVDALLDLRKQINEHHRDAHLTLNDLLIKACATALMEVPAVNIQWSGDGILKYLASDISVVTVVDGGLSTPIVRSANTKSVWEISREVSELMARAAANTLTMDEIVGGSFSISNLGMYGIDQFDAIINAPQCAILAIGAAKPRAVVTQERALRIATVMTVTLSVDHRAIDGVSGALFLSALRKCLEQPERLRPQGRD
jgi:pyruvate dehydrogenase E2 component (dihydrolipoamide acetyltransferase)